MHSFTLTERIFPTLVISRGEGPTAPLSYAPQQIDISALTVSDPVTGRTMTVAQLLDRRIVNSGLIAIHKGRIVHESYRNTLSRELRHLNFSTSKSFMGMLAQIAKQKGCFDENDLASKYVKELLRERRLERRDRPRCLGHA
jgi:CubicO group peptidase (beta-lactamase class C family)